jgi:hypothetical protein
VVDEVMNDVTEQLANAREVLLQTDGAGTLGIVSSVDTVNQIYTLNSTPFGTRLLQAGLTVEIVNPATNLKRGLKGQFFHTHPSHMADQSCSLPA